MSNKAKTKPTDSRPPCKPEEDPLAYEMWLTEVAEHGSVEQRGGAEDLLLQELQRREPQKRSGKKKPGKTGST